MLLSLVTGIAVGFIQLSLPPQKLKMQLLVNKSCPILELKPLPGFHFSPSVREGTSPGAGGEQEKETNPSLTPCQAQVGLQQDNSSSGVILTLHPGDERAHGVFLQPGSLKSLQEFLCRERSGGSYVAGGCHCQLCPSSHQQGLVSPLCRARGGPEVTR